MRVLVVNAGSSSLKLRLLGPDDELLDARDLEAEGGRPADGELEASLSELGAPDAVGYRIVHGGPELTAPTRVDGVLLTRLGSVATLAPLHVPPALESLRAVGAVLPDVPGVACFDTAFHATIGPAASTYAVPREWREQRAVRRYGFHGLSHAYAARRAAALLGRERQGLRVITAHLGAGASLAAVRDGRCVDTTMGFTPLEGLVMATRSGTVDPGLVVWLVRDAGVPVEEVGAALERRSGLLGLAGTADMREVLARADAGEQDASLALDVYLHRLRREIAGMAAALDGLDALVFTGGVGEASAAVRERAANGLGFLGVEIDPERNAAVQGDGVVGAAGAAAATLVVAAREDLEIARQVRATLA